MTQMRDAHLPYTDHAKECMTMLEMMSFRELKLILFLSIVSLVSNYQNFEFMRYIGEGNSDQIGIGILGYSGLNACICGMVLNAVYHLCDKRLIARRKITFVSLLMLVFAFIISIVLVGIAVWIIVMDTRIF